MYPIWLFSDLIKGLQCKSPLGSAKDLMLFKPPKIRCLLQSISSSHLKLTCRFSGKEALEAGNTTGKRLHGEISKA